MPDDELSGALAPPMSNGEVVFEAPWQGRVFGMARALAEAGLYDWDEFREYLIAELARGAPPDTGDFAYYDHFLAAFERLLAARGLASADAVARRVALLAARPHGHDHR